MGNIMYSNLKIWNNNITPSHLVDVNPWPILSAFAVFAFVVHLTSYYHGQTHSGIPILAFYVLVYTAANWWIDVMREAVFEGQHTFSVQAGIKKGFILFICSEVMFFFAFFWAFFHSSFNPDLAIGGVWPPVFLTTLNVWSLPCLNTALLITSGIAITSAHSYIYAGECENTLETLMITVHLGLAFSIFQLFEYRTLPFSISDSVYSACFYIATGFHGLHVLIGTIFITVSASRLNRFEHFTRTHHIGFESAILYWHFVDIVWLFLFVAIYWWGS